MVVLSRPPSKMLLSMRACDSSILGPAFNRRSALFVLALFSSLVTLTAAQAETLQEATKLYRQGAYEESIEAARLAIEGRELSENIRLLKIRAEMDIGRYSDALRTLEAALQRFPASIQLRWIGRDVYRFNGQEDRAERLDLEIAALIRQAPERYSDVLSQVTAGRYLIAHRTDPKAVLDGIYKEVKRLQPNLVEVYLATGELALEKHDYELAGDNFQQAAKIDAANADAHFGVAQAFAPSDSEKAEASLELALDANPNHIPSLLMLAENQIDSEQYDEAEKLLSRAIEINPHQPQALAYRAVISHLRNQLDVEKVQREAALKHWPTNPQVDHLIGKKLSQKYRFAEGEQYQRRAIALDANYLPAKMQLAQDLLRLGREDEGLALAQEVYEVDDYNLFAHNLVMLEESLTRFRTIEEEGLIVRMDAQEAEIYGSRVLDLLKRAKNTLSAKYDVELTQPITVEIFPKQQDFAIRTFGLPGGAGFLGVCFGPVITANSPASQGANPSNWEATLWHEFCHVVTLHKTNNKMPRWLSEGISVYEERQENKSWGQAINPKYREMILGDDLTPVSELSGAFLQPKSPLHLQFAYYESSLVVEYLVQEHGLETLKRVLVDLGVGMPINEALARYAGSIEAVDAGFKTYAHDLAKSMAPEVDWSQPELPRTAKSTDIREWLKEHPNNYLGLRRLAQALIAEEAWEDAKQPLERMIELYPDDNTAENPHEILAKVYHELGETEQERAVLDKVVQLAAANSDALSRLTEIASEAKDWPKAREYAMKSLAINPLVPGPHRAAALAAVNLGDHQLATDSYEALLAMEPFDPAEIHMNLATSFETIGELAQAKRHALLALEQTPRYRAAQKRLLSIVRRLELENTRPAIEEPSPDTSSNDSESPAAR